MSVSFLFTRGFEGGVLAWPMPRMLPAFQVLKSFFLDFPALRPQGRERPGEGPVSNSALKRWLQNHSVQINGQCPGPDDPVSDCVRQLVFFPNNPASRITML